MQHVTTGLIKFVKDIYSKSNMVIAVKPKLVKQNYGTSIVPYN